LRRNLILLELEPLVGYTIAEVQSNTAINDNTKVFKANFGDLISRFELENEALENYKPEMELKPKVKDIKAILEGYAKELTPTAPAEPAATI